MVLDVEKGWLPESYRNSLLLELKTINSEIEKADSPPSQSNLEILRDCVLLAVEIINSGSRDDYWFFIELCYSLSLVLPTISEVDSPPLQLIIKRLLFRPFFMEAIGLRQFTYPPSQLLLDRWSHVTLKNKLYLYFCCSSGRYRYTLFEIELPISFHDPPTKATQDAEISRPSPFKPILQLETSKYPDGMCCVQVGPELYFFGGNFMNRTLPTDVYVFNLILYHKCPDLLRRMNEDMLLPCRPMYSGKACPQAFVADSKIYAIGSNLEGFEVGSHFYFEYYDPRYNFWYHLPNPPIRGRYKWVGNAVVGENAFLVGMQGQTHVYCFNFKKEQWIYRFRNSHIRNFTSKTEFVGNGLYGCCHNTVVKLAVSDELRDMEIWCQSKEEEEEEEDEEEEGGEEEDEFQQVERLLRECRYSSLCMVSRENGMDAIYNVPRQVQSSTTLLHLGSGYFCYVRTGKPPPQIHDDEVDDDDIPANRDRFTRIVIFQTAPDSSETYEENMLFRAQFVYSKHYTYYSRFGEDIFIKGCYFLGRLG